MIRKTDGRQPGDAPASSAPLPAPPGGVAPADVSSQANEEFLCEFIGEC